MAGVYYNYVLNGYIMVPIIIILWCYNRSGCRPIVARAGSNREVIAEKIELDEIETFLHVAAYNNNRFSPCGCSSEVN